MSINALWHYRKQYTVSPAKLTTLSCLLSNRCKYCCPKFLRQTRTSLGRTCVHRSVATLSLHFFIIHWEVEKWRAYKYTHGLIILPWLETLWDEMYGICAIQLAAVQVEDARLGLIDSSIFSYYLTKLKIFWPAHILFATLLLSK
jgi:hypothetical protein